MIKLVWTTEKRKVKDLLKLAINPRKISEKRKKELIQSLEKFNLVDIPVIDTDETVISGNQRITALIVLGRGEEEIDVRVPNRKLTKKELKEYNIIANIHYGEFDFELLDDEFSTDLEIDITTEISGFKEWKIEQTNINSILDDPNIDEIPPEPKNIFVVRGDIFEIKANGVVIRVGCLDSCNSDDIEKLTKKNKIDLIVTDPPYGVNYDPKWRENLKHQRKGTSNGEVIANDDLTDWSIAYSLYNSDVIYVWHASDKTIDFGLSLKKCEYELKYLIVWNKDLMVLSRGDYHWKHEICWYAIKKGCNHNWQGDKTQTTVWDIPTIHSFANGKNKEEWGLVGHGNQKPLECMERPIKNNSKEFQYIGDPFCGTGTTAIACLKTKRNCFTNDISENYVQVSVKRIIDFCKRNAIEFSITLNDNEFNISKLD